MLEFYPVTILLGVVSLMVTAIVGIGIGMVSASRRDSWIDNALTLFAYLGISIPNFVVGVFLIYLVSLHFHWLPTSGFVSPLDDFWLCIKKMIMPVMCLSLHGIASTSRIMRSSLLEVLGQDYIRTAWAKGLKERVIIYRHALKNSLIPIVTVLGMGFRRIVGGSMIIETIFAIPGVGRLMVTSLYGQDYVVVQAGALVTAVIIVSSNLIVDISYGWLDPRIRYS
jgi:peptide/nickel transport system permease protein